MSKRSSCSALVAARTAALVLLVAAGWPAVPALAGPPIEAVLAPGPKTFDLALEAACAGLVALSWVWLQAVVLLTAAEALAHAAHRERLATLTERLARPTAPAGARRVLLGLCGVALSTSAFALPASAVTRAAPGAAGSGAPGPGAAVTAPDLTGLALPDRVAGDRRAFVTVRPGDSLWAIAGRLLPAASGDEQVAAAVRRLEAANRAALGAHPDLIHPGTRLRVPALLHRRDHP